MQAKSYRYSSKREDIDSACFAQRKRDLAIGRRSSRRRIAIVALSILVGLAASIVAQGLISKAGPFLSPFISAVVLFITAYFTMRALDRVWQPPLPVYSRNRPPIAPTSEETMTFDEERITFEGPGTGVWFKWSDLATVFVLDGFVFLRRWSGTDQLIPSSAFGSDAELNEFLAFARSRGALEASD